MRQEVLVWQNWENNGAGKFYGDRPEQLRILFGMIQSSCTHTGDPHALSFHTEWEEYLIASFECMGQEY